ncbi:hypothetical protein B0T14DRAFT_523075 [Immersiella caudata]|uniref:Secreted protein n=1 Tax=Immersiella caudata TaxID=314043 RepID=A0AA39WJ65_9PEZI|nr:hypothetical protein B0T14DRAFT_523075 [Immersiella caudata]
MPATMTPAFFFFLSLALRWHMAGQLSWWEDSAAVCIWRVGDTMFRAVLPTYVDHHDMRTQLKVGRQVAIAIGCSTRLCRLVAKFHEPSGGRCAADLSSTTASAQCGLDQFGADARGL